MIRSGIFNSVNGDRGYKAEDFAYYFSRFIANGIFPNPSTNFQVVENGGMSVNLKAGDAWINGYYVANNANYNLTIETADGVLKRIDRIVLQLNYLNREITPKVKKGTFASSPVAPSLKRDADAYEIALADIYVGAGVLSIIQTNISDLRLNKDLCGIVHGTVDQVDTTAIFNQYQAWFGEKSVEFEVEFRTFLDDLKALLSGDVAGNLLNKITTVEGSLGDVTALKTTNKTNTVAAINEVKEEVASHKADDVQHLNYAVASGTNTYIVSIANITALAEGISVKIKFTNANTGASTLNINGLGAKTIQKSNGNALSSGNIKVGQICHLVYTGSVFQLLGEGGEYGTATAGDVRNTKTVGTENGVVPGTLDLSLLTPSNLRKGVTIDGVTGDKLKYGTGDRVHWSQLGLNGMIGLVAPYHGGSSPGFRLDSATDDGALLYNVNNDYYTRKLSKDGVLKWGISLAILANNFCCSDYYYVITSSNMLCKLNPATGSSIVASSSSIYAKILGIYNGIIYCRSTSDKVIACRASDLSPVTISSALSSSTLYYGQIVGKFLYIGYLSSILKYDISTLGSESLIWSYGIASADCRGMVVDSNGYVYYINTNVASLFKLKLDGSELLSLSNVGSNMYTLAIDDKEYIYAKNNSTVTTIIDSSNMTMVVNPNVGVVGGWYSSPNKKYFSYCDSDQAKLFTTEVILN